WLRERLLRDGLPAWAAEERARGVRLSFEPADIVNEVMSLGAPTPIEVAVSGPKPAENRAYAEKVREQLADIASLRDLQFMQPLDYPTVDVKVDRERLGRLGGNVKELTDSVVAATSSSRYMVPLFWPDPTTGIGFQVQVEVPQDKMRSQQDVALVQVRDRDGAPPLRVRDAAAVRRGPVAGGGDRRHQARPGSPAGNSRARAGGGV